MMKVAVVDYGSGNLASASRGAGAGGGAAGLAAKVFVTADPDVVAAADRIVLPGQGAFADCAQGLHGCDRHVGRDRRRHPRRARRFSAFASACN